jgi:hypothetical protein
MQPNPGLQPPASRIRSCRVWAAPCLTWERGTPAGEAWSRIGPVTRKLRPDLIVNVAGGELFPFGILHWQSEQKMGENLPVDAPKPGKVAGSSGYVDNLVWSKNWWCPSIACIKGLQRDPGRWLIESVDECQIALR